MDPVTTTVPKIMENIPLENILLDQVSQPYISDQTQRLFFIFPAINANMSSFFFIVYLLNLHIKFTQHFVTVFLHHLLLHFLLLHDLLSLHSELFSFLLFYLVKILFQLFLLLFNQSYLLN